MHTTFKIIQSKLLAHLKQYNIYKLFNHISHIMKFNRLPNIVEKYILYTYNITE